MRQRVIVATPVNSSPTGPAHDVKESLTDKRLPAAFFLALATFFTGLASAHLRGGDAKMLSERVGKSRSLSVANLVCYYGYGLFRILQQLPPGLQPVFQAILRNSLAKQVFETKRQLVAVDSNTSGQRFDAGPFGR